MANKHLITTDTIDSFNDVDETGSTENKMIARDSSNTLITKTIVKETHFQCNQQDNVGAMAGIRISNNSTSYLTFKIPDDWVSNVSLELAFIPLNNGTDRDLDLASMYAEVGQNYDRHDSTDTVTLDWGNDIRQDIDISGLYNNIVAGDVCGLKITNPDVPADTITIAILGIYLKYNASQGV